MNAQEIVRRRLANQDLNEPRAESADAVVARLGAVQAQDFAGAKWALGLRMQNATDAAVEHAFDAGEILRTHVLRPTWHFVAPRDLVWMLALSAPRVHQVNASMYRKMELDAAAFRHSRAIFVKTLQGGRQCTREELGAELEQAKLHADGTRLAYMLMHAELEGVVCSGARRGKQFTYALLADRAPHAQPLPREHALHELTRRYFATRGPATLKDFAWWSGLTLADAQKGIASNQKDFVAERIGTETYWFAPNALPAQKISPTAHLLPNYDEYFIGHADRSAMAARIGAKSLKVLERTPFAHVILIDGQMVGGWKRTLDKRGVHIEWNFHVALNENEQAAIQRAAEGLGTFLKLAVFSEFAQ